MQEWVRETRAWHAGQVDSPIGPVPRVATDLRWQDDLGALKVRLCIGRTSYGVEPGLYAVGNPSGDSPVLVSANYKLSFDRLRQELGGLDLWILVLDTRGVNVWCAAAKGTFGTDEVVHRVQATRLAEVVKHRTLIVPQLGAPGVAAHQVKERCGFAVEYGPVRARDIPAFLAAGMKATPEMRRVRFNLWDRLAVIPVELIHWAGYALPIAAVLSLVSVFIARGQDLRTACQGALTSALLVLGAYLAGGVATPVLLPWLPGRAFSVKGAVVGVLLFGVCVLAGWIPGRPTAGCLPVLAWALMLPAVSAFMAMNYTGTSTYTSQSGVRREMRFAVPAQIVAGAIGLGLWVAAHVV